MRVLTIDVPHLGNRTHLVHDGRVGSGRRRASRLERGRVRRGGRQGIDIVAVAETHIHNDYVSGGLVPSRSVTGRSTWWPPTRRSSSPASACTTTRRWPSATSTCA